MIVCVLIPIIILVAILWVRGIDTMHNEHPDYRGEDLFNEEQEDK